MKGQVNALKGVTWSYGGNSAERQWGHAGMIIICPLGRSLKANQGQPKRGCYRNRYSPRPLNSKMPLSRRT